MVNIKPIHHFILICLYTISNSVIEVPITINDQKLPTIPITLGGNQTFNVVVDTGSQHFWVADEASTVYVTTKYNKASPTFSDLHKTFIANYTTGEQVRGNLGEETFSIPSTGTDAIKMDFGLAMSGSLMLDKIDGFLGFGRNYNSHIELTDKSDLLLQLKNHNLISQRIFSLKYYNNTSTNKLEGTLYLGDWNKSLVVPSNSSNTYECSIIKSYTHEWACKLSHIIIGDPESFRTTAIPVDKDAFFNTGSSSNILPIEYLEIFKKKFKFSNATCRNETMEGYEHLYCDKIEEIPSMYFVFGEYGINVDMNNFFSKVTDEGKTEYVFRFVFSYKHDHIVFGVTLLKDYQLYFDEERSVVGFYNSNQTKIRHLIAYMKPHWFAYILVVILFILEGVMVLWFVYWCKKSKTLDTTAESALVSAESLGDIGGKMD